MTPADYEILSHGENKQPLLVDTWEHISNTPEVIVKLDGNILLTETLEEGRYVLEAPMPAVDQTCESTYEIMIDQQTVRSGTVTRRPKTLVQPAQYVDTMMGAGHSRWMLAPGPWMPFGMVKLSPDNQNPGWQGGYQPTFENIGTFSHITSGPWPAWA